MSRTQRFLATRWRGLATLCALVGLFGIAAILWARIDSSDRRADELAAEADLRGNAVSTLATDVRKLRSQIVADGKTPVAPDPTAAVDDLPNRAAVPVPIPGPKGDKGDKGDPGQSAPAPSPIPGPTGATGLPGEPGRDGAAGTPGKDGAAGKDGAPGTPGKDGADGKPPAGWTYTDPQGVTYTCTPVAGFDPAAPRYACTATAPSTPEQPGQRKPVLSSLVALAPDRRRY
ncbi:collagen-like protein [Streptomyces sp. NPDC056069]|uniref:collagen-like protein n=1 Tax=Streptomyces sp. NPDC056069 TaxID=3345702 RepID=UPI0035D7AF23